MADIYDYDNTGRYQDPYYDPYNSGGGSGGAGGDGYYGGGGIGTGSPVGVAASSSGFQDMVVEENGTLALAYGRHVVAGHLILHKYDAGPPPTSIVFVALGEGPWDSIEKLWYAGNELSLSPDGSTEGYHFHPGTESASLADPTQGQDSFYPSGLTYNRTAYVAVKLPEAFATEDRPDKLRGLFKCLKVKDYDANGVETDAGSYSVNPARVAADLIIERAGLPVTRIDWPSWARWKDYCDETISWDNGTTTDNIPRFECHSVFIQPVNLADALTAVTSASAAYWQDDGEVIRFVIAPDTERRHHFTESNIVAGSLQVYPRDVREMPNKLIAKFRDLDDEFLSETSVEARRDALIDRYGENDTGVRYFPNMNRSQAQRLLERQLRIETDNPILVELKGQGDSMHLLPGDFVYVSHPALGWEYVSCVIIEASDESAEQSADERSFLMQRIDGSIYNDTDHDVRQEAVTP